MKVNFKSKEATSITLIPTLNKYGFMFNKPDPYSQKFIEFVINKQGMVLDIGVAFGNTTVAALKAGAYVIANDLDYRHLNILYSNLEPYLRAKLLLKPGHFPDEFELPENILEAVLASGVLHYIRAEKLEYSIQKIYKSLKKGGRLYLFQSTPFSGAFKNFLNTYSERVQLNSQWPGVMENSWSYALHLRHQIPKYMNLFDYTMTTRILEKAGFNIIDIKYVSMTDYPDEIRHLGQEYIGAIAEKL